MREPTPAQRRAADPARSVWVTANAGTGKTRVLSDRVLRLLLAGAEPECILCLTFTKAAAAEMTKRLEEQLAAWATAQDDAVLGEELRKLTGAEPSRALLDRARRLFAQVLELPRGLPVMTLHALCGSLLRRFPLEAGVAPHFETIDERTAAEMLVEAREAVLLAARDTSTALGTAVERLAIWLTEMSLTDALGEVLAKRVAIRAAIDRHKGLDGLLNEIARTLEVDGSMEPPQIVARACADGVYEAQGLHRLASVFAQGGQQQQECAAHMATWLSAVAEDRVLLYPRWRGVFLTKDKEIRTGIIRDAFRRNHPDAAEVYTKEAVRLFRVEQAIKSLMIFRRTEALLRVGVAVIEAYERQKAQAAALDYDDLIERTRALLADPGRAAWVLFKMDAHVDHVLVDEAQDTSPAQWEIVERLTEEFRAGAGTSPRPRTLFVVGDEKQSIYSFQGADLANFRGVRERLLKRAEGSEIPFAEEVLDKSFRSVRAVLEIVDAVLADPIASGGVVAQGETVKHDTERAHEAGHVELWPLALPDQDGVVHPWALPDEVKASDVPERRVARAVAARIGDWLTSGEMLHSEGRPVTPGDILILVGRRGIVQDLLIRALKAAGVPVAGADRLTLTDHLAVKDLIAAGRILLLPEDDLTLASVLKSPLLGLDEDHLFELAHGRGHLSLMERLRAAAGEGRAPFVEVYGRLEGWLRRADFMPPFELFTWMLGADGGRKRLLTRLGPDAAEPIEAFLGQALAYEEGHPASLEGFLHWLCLGAGEVTRDPEKTRDVVRVVTVHGGKGLEAPIVILADAGPHGSARTGRLVWGNGLPFWRCAAAERDAHTDGLVEDQGRRDEEERRRLLYVALTRARDRLYVTGWQGKSDGKDCWHGTVEKALRGLGAAPVTHGLGEEFLGDGLRHGTGVPRAAAEAAARVKRAEPALPSWAQQTAPVEQRPPRPLAPSRADEVGEPPPTSPVSEGSGHAYLRGRLAHRLLQLLPEVQAERRSHAATTWLAKRAAAMSDLERAALAAEVLDVLAMPALQAAFAPGSRAEQPLAGVLGEHVVVGQIDRMAVTDREVLLVDYKTNRQPPGDVTSTPVAYLRQLAAYRALLRRIYPGREVRAGLVWTQGPRLDLIPPSLLDRWAPGGAP